MDADALRNAIEADGRIAELVQGVVDGEFDAELLEAAVKLQQIGEDFDPDDELGL